MRRCIDITDIDIPSDENDYDELVALADAIAGQDIIELPEQRWVPVSEALPKPKSDEQRRGYYLTTNAYESVGLTRYEFYDDFQKTGWQSDIRIIAWRELPEPWRGEK